MRRAWALAAFSIALAAAPAAEAQRCRGSQLSLVPETIPVSEGEGDETTAVAVTDRIGRVVAEVMVNGQGPYRFIIDTGANHSAISRELAGELGLASTEAGQVHTINEAALTQLVNLDSVQYAGVTFGDVRAPLIDRPVLAGEDGLLGVDGMAGRRLVMDFENGCVEIANSRGARRLHGWTDVQGQLRFGHLALIDGYVRGRRVNILLDTGSASSLANTAFRDLLSDISVRQDAGRVSIVRAFSSGAPLILSSSMFIPEIEMGDVRIDGVNAYLGDFHIFDLWGLRDEPTLLVGMDVLGKASAMAIDYSTGRVYFRLPWQQQTGNRMRGHTSSPVTVFAPSAPPRAVIPQP